VGAATERKGKFVRRVSRERRHDQWNYHSEIGRLSTRSSYLPSINARERGACQASESTHTACDNGRCQMFLTLPSRSDQWAPQCFTKPKSLRTQLPQLIHKAISLGNSVADSISDPWEEAAKLSELPKDTATHRWLRWLRDCPVDDWHLRIREQLLVPDWTLALPWQFKGADGWDEPRPSTFLC